MSERVHGFEELPSPVAFVLSGGTSLGALQVGMLQAVLDVGIKPDLLVGSSVGSLNAAFIARGFERAAVEQLARVWESLKASDVFGHVSFKRIMNVFAGSESLASNEALRKLIMKHVLLPHQEIVIPTHLVATDILSGEPVILSEGDLCKNLLASTAIPFIFPPYSFKITAWLTEPFPPLSLYCPLKSSERILWSCLMWATPANSPSCRPPRWK